MKTLSYLSALAFLFKTVEARKIFDLRYKKEDLDPEWFLEQKADSYLFDIDDTLQAWGNTLNEKSALFLNQLLEKGKNVALVTNCSAARFQAHSQRLKDYHCKAELFERGQKPNSEWLKKLLVEKNWKGETCLFMGDRPTMDLIFAKRAGIAKVVWRQGLLKFRPSVPPSWLNFLENLWLAQCCK